MAATGEVVYGWRVFNQSIRRRVWFGWVEEPVFELVKGQRHIQARGQDGIDPQIVLDQAITRALEDDIREATESGDLDVVVRLEAELARHEVGRNLRRNGHAMRRALVKTGRAAVFVAPTAEAMTEGMQ